MYVCVPVWLGFRYSGLLCKVEVRSQPLLCFQGYKKLQKPNNDNIGWHISHNTIPYRIRHKNIELAVGSSNIFTTHPICYGIMLSHPILYQTWYGEYL